VNDEMKECMRGAENAKTRADRVQAGGAENETRAESNPAVRRPDPMRRKPDDAIRALRRVHIYMRSKEKQRQCGGAGRRKRDAQYGNEECQQRRGKESGTRGGAMNHFLHFFIMRAMRHVRNADAADSRCRLCYSIAVWRYSPYSAIRCPAAARYVG